MSTKSPFSERTYLLPIRLSQRQEVLCARLDSLHEPYGLNAKPSDMLKGAIFAIREECKKNDDRLAQAAHSLREIIYPLKKTNISSEGMKGAFKRYGSISYKYLENEIDDTYKILCDLAHHCSDPKHPESINYKIGDFSKLLYKFEVIMLVALNRQLDLHAKILGFIASGPPQNG